jgi:hypothetical protein
MRVTAEAPERLVGIVASRVSRERRAVEQATAARLIERAAQHRIEGELRSADRRVRSHEQIHLALAGPYAGSSASYITVRGPDGRSYVVGGSVRVDLKPVPGDPEATIRKAQAIRRAAYGPMSPSAADMRVAAEAYRMEVQARKELEEEEQGSSQIPGENIDILA